MNSQGKHNDETSDTLLQTAKFESLPTSCSRVWMKVLLAHVPLATRPNGLNGPASPQNQTIAESPNVSVKANTRDLIPLVALT